MLDIKFFFYLQQIGPVIKHGKVPTYYDQDRSSCGICNTVINTGSYLLF